ncbi:MAG: hypothetical protein SGILL_002329, partial [Bacillariaceae sp.]
MASSPGNAVSTAARAFERQEKHVIQVETSKRSTVKETVEISNICIQEKRSVTEASSEDLSHGGSFVRSFSSDGENKVPGARPKSSRVARFMKAKRAQSPAPLLKNALSAAKTVMEEEKSTAGSSTASTSSSLSNKELSEIASRAFQMAGARKGVSPVEEERPGSIRGMRTISKVSHQDARLALLSAAKKKNNKEDVTQRLGEKAARVAKKNNASKPFSEGNTNMGVSSSASVDSSKSRRVEHPAFAARASPVTKKAVSSADIMSSFRQFNYIRTTTTKKTVPETKKKDVANRKSTEFSSNKFHLPAAKALTDSLHQRKTVTTPKGKKEPTGSSRHDRMSIESGEHSMASESSFPDQADTMHSHSMKPEDATMHSSVNQDESMHSTTERQYLDGFYQMGRIQITSTKNGQNDAYLSSLSSNTFSNASIMSQSLASTMKSPAGRQAEKVAFMLEPTPEYSNQTMKSEVLLGSSPGPSNRSARSFANSIVSASPCSAAPASPAFDADFDAYFSKPTKSSGESSDKDSAELVDAAIDAAMDDMLKENDILGDVNTERDTIFEAQHDSKLMTIDPPKETIVPIEIISPKRRAVGSKSVAILPNASGRSNSPPGFIFNDSDESDVIAAPDPVGQDNFTMSDNVFGSLEDDDASDNEQGESDKSDQSFGAELRQGLLKVDSSVEFPSDGDFFPEKKESGEQHGSSSTKQTVSTSIRTGFSSIQNEAPEGSTSIRSGLSGIQEKSNSFRAENSAFKPLTNKSDKKFSQDPKPSVLQDTIQEETESKSNIETAELRDEQTSFSGFKSKDGQTSFSVKDKDTSTTDGSSGSGGSNSSDPISSFSGAETGQYTGYETPGDQPYVEEKESLFKNLLPPIETDDDASSADKGTALTTPASRMSTSWKGGNFGKRVGDAIKNVLAKASPRATPSTPSAHGTKSALGTSSAKNQESLLFSSMDDDDDIFGGLEDDNTATEEPVKAPVIAPKTPKDTAKTPKQRNSKVAAKNESSRSRSGKLTPVKPPKTEPRLSNAHNVPLTSRSKKKHMKNSSPSSDPVSMYSDRSGTIVDESEVLHVNSDITSSLIGGPISTPTNPTKEYIEKIIIEDKKKDKQSSPSAKSKSSSKKSKTSKHSCKSDAATSRKSLHAKVEEPIDKVAPEIQLADDKEEKPAPSVFMRLSCGGLADFSTGFASLCTQSNKADVDDLPAEEVPEIIKDNTSVSSHSRLTDLEKKVWSEWDRLNGGSVNNDESLVETTNEEQQPTTKSKAMPVVIKKETQPVEIKEEKEDREKKREAARDKLLDIASSAMSSHLSGRTGFSTPVEDKTDQSTLITNDNELSASESVESGVTKDTGSGESGGSATASGTESGESAGSSSSREYTSCSSGEYSSGIDSASDFVSMDPSNSSSTKSPGPVAVTTPSAGPILLSFSQRSLMDKFSKQLTAVGVEVLKLNRRSQWQVRFFTVSKEQIALSAHEAISKTGELARCPKALLWLKKYNPKNGGYGITNIDKDGHGGMLLVDLLEIEVSDGKVDMVQHPLPKKLADKFKNSVLLTLKYKMNGSLRSIEF